MVSRTAALTVGSRNAGSGGGGGDPYAVGMVVGCGSKPLIFGRPKRADHSDLSSLLGNSFHARSMATTC